MPIEGVETITGTGTHRILAPAPLRKLGSGPGIAAGSSGLSPGSFSAGRRRAADHNHNDDDDDDDDDGEGASTPVLRPLMSIQRPGDLAGLKGSTDGGSSGG